VTQEQIVNKVIELTEKFSRHEEAVFGLGTRVATLEARKI
jgi:hypothetical protein